MQLSEVFKNLVLKNFPNFTRKQLCRNFNKKRLQQENFKNIFFTEHPRVTASGTFCKEYNTMQGKIFGRK